MVKARKQLTRPVGPQKSDKPKSTYNIWYNKYSGESHSRGEPKQKAASRCNIGRDAGETRGTHQDSAGVCLNFARGCCPLGYDCTWLHVLPDSRCNAELAITRDCFGRERHSEVRDDQSGVGSFTADDETSRTLYIGGISHHTHDMNSVVYKHFSEWGVIDNIKVLEAKGVAFVRYHYRCNAEFALEAMQRQTLDDNEVLNVRWATKDPNPWAERRKRLADEKQMLEAVDQKRPCLAIAANINAGDVGDGVLGNYPDTDDQYEQYTKVDQPTYAHPDSSHSLSQQPQTLTDLVAWSQKQALHSSAASEDKAQATKVETQGSLPCPIVSTDYDSSSDNESS